MEKRVNRPNPTARHAYKVTPAMRQVIYQMLGEWYSLREIAAAIKKQFGVRLHHSTVEDVPKRFPEEAEPAIKAARESFQAIPIMNFPMANKAWRVREILQMYLDSDPKKDKFFRAKLLALGRAEIGENFDKLANAIRDSGGDTVVNIVNYDGAEFDRAVRELAAVGANSNTPSRF